MDMMKNARQDCWDLFIKATDSTTRIVEAVRDDQWGNATPCAEWDMRALVSHVTSENLWIEQYFTGRTMADVGDSLNGDLLGDEPIAAYKDSVARARATISEQTIEGTYGFSFGQASGRDYLTQIFADQFIHGWDIARGSRQDLSYDDELIAAAIPVMEEMVAFVGQGSVFGYRQEVADTAASMTRLLGIVGRKDDWKAPEGATWV